MFKWVVKNKITASNAIYLEDSNGQEGRPFKARFLQAGLVKYDFGVCLLKKETIDKFVDTFVECPVIIDHKDNIGSDDVKGTINKIWFSPEDGWYWCSGILTDDEAIKLVENGYNVSCQYAITDYFVNIEGKLHNGNEYDKEILDGVFEHLAIVENPRYEDAFIAVNAYMACNKEFKEADHPRDEEGKFTEGNTSSFYNEESKTIELKGDELGSTDDEIRENGLKYFKENYQGKKFDNPELSGILFSRVGLNKLKSNSADIEKIKAIPALKDIIEQGKYQGAEVLAHSREDGIIKFHRINADVSINGHKENMSVLIGEDRDGNRFYNLNNKTYTAENSSRVIRAKGRADEEFHINIIAFNSQDFKPDRYKTVFDYIRTTKGEPMDKETKGVFEQLINALKARNEAEEDETKEKKKEETAANEEVDKRDIIRQIMAIAGKHEDNEDVRTIAKLAEKLAYDKSEAGTADNKAKNEDDNKDEGEKKDAEEAKNKCKNEGEEPDYKKLYEELKDKTEKEAENKKAKNALDEAVNKIYSAINPEIAPDYISEAKGLELGKQIYG